MRLCLFPRDSRGNPLHDSLARGFAQTGAELVPDPSDADYTVIFAQHGFDPETNYTGIEKIEGRFAFIDATEWGWWTHHEIGAKEYASIFSPMVVQRAPFHQDLITFLHGKSYPYFRREFYKCVDYPRNYYPIDYPLHKDALASLVTFEEFCKRSLFLYCRWGISHPTRAHLMNTLRKSKVPTFLSDQKIPPEQYFHEAGTAKAGISYDGYGSSSFREMEIGVRALLFKNELAIRQYHPVPAVTYHVAERVEYRDKAVDGKWGMYAPEFEWTDLNDVIEVYMHEPGLCYVTYHNQWENITHYHTEMAHAAYILDVLEHHDWSVTTEPVI